MGDQSYLKIDIRVSQYEKRSFQEAKQLHGLSARDILEAFFMNCKKDVITIFKNGKEIKLNKNTFLSIRK